MYPMNRCDLSIRMKRMSLGDQISAYNNSVSWLEMKTLTGSVTIHLLKIKAVIAAH